MSNAGPGGTTRARKIITLTIANGAAVTGAFNFSPYASGSVIMSAGWDAADLGIQFAKTEDGSGTYHKLKDLSSGYGTDVSIDGCAADEAHLLPTHLFGGWWCKLWSHNGSGVDVDQTAERTLTLILKS